MEVSIELVAAAFGAMWAAGAALAREVRNGYRDALAQRDQENAELKAEVKRLTAENEKEQAEWRRLLIQQVSIEHGDLPSSSSPH